MNPSSAQTKKNLVQAFWMLYRTRDLSEITVKDVASKAGYYRTTFYKYFNSIEDILNYVHQLMMPESQDQEAILSTGRLMDAYVDTFIKAADYLIDLTGPGADAVFYEMHMNELRVFTRDQVYKKKQQEDDEFDLGFEFFYAGSLFALNRWYANYRDKISVEKLKELMNDINERGFTQRLAKED